MSSDPRIEVTEQRSAPSVRSVLRPVGSLWFAAVLLVLWLVAMASATVFESIRGTERALATFYYSWWFELILALLAINVLTAMALRFPFSKRRIGFVVTHVGVIVTLAGAVGTQVWGVNGQVTILEGQTAKEFSVSKPTLTIRKLGERSKSAVDLTASVFSGFTVVDHPRTAELNLGKVRVEVLRYLPDSEWSRQILNDGSVPQSAIELTFAPPGEGERIGLLDGEGTREGSIDMAYRVVRNQAELDRLLSESPRAFGQSGGLVKIDYKGTTFDIPLKTCLDKAVPLGDTGYTIRVLRYLPHAVVGDNRKLTNASDRPVNPAIEAEISGPDGTETRLAFAKFPDFGSMHGGRHNEDLKLTFVAPQSHHAHSAPIEVFGGLDGSLHVRFSRNGMDVVTHPLTVGTPVESPWPGRKLTVWQQLDRATAHWVATPIDPIRDPRIPAVLVKLTTDTDAGETWVQKHGPQTVSVDGEAYDLLFANKTLPLGFAVTLDSFQIGYYPGGRKPRSFESRITIIDPAAGSPQNRMVSMNHPIEYRGYTFYQSSYRMGEDRSTSTLSVSRDPGKPIVFAGYITIIVGMLVGLVIRAKDQRRKERAPALAEVIKH